MEQNLSSIGFTALCIDAMFAIKNGRINVKKYIANCIWNLSEFTGFGLGRYAPSVFETMIGRKSKKVNKDFEA